VTGMTAITIDAPRAAEPGLGSPGPQTAGLGAADPSVMMAGGSESVSCGRTRKRSAVIRARGAPSVHGKEKVYGSIP
jgi:hypothetical protein